VGNQMNQRWELCGEMRVEIECDREVAMTEKIRPLWGCGT